MATDKKTPVFSHHDSTSTGPAFIPPLLQSRTDCCRSLVSIFYNYTSKVLKGSKMQLLFFTSLLAVSANAHGVLLKVEGANGVTAPGACGKSYRPSDLYWHCHPCQSSSAINVNVTLLVLDGTPRDCIVNACGAQADTAIIRDHEISTGKHGALGWTQGGGDCKPDAVIGEYMGLGQAPRYTGGRKPTGKEDPIESGRKRRREEHVSRITALFSRQSIISLPLVGFLGFGGKRTSYPVETIVGDSAGKGKTDGLPTTNDNGELILVYRQVSWAINSAAVIIKKGYKLIYSRLMKMVPGQCWRQLIRHQQVQTTGHSNRSKFSNRSQVMVLSAYLLQQTPIST